MYKKTLVIILTFFIYSAASSQFLMDMVDTTKDVGKGILSIYQKFDRIKINGYVQPQWQWAEEKGTKSFNGGDFGPNVNNRFMLRRGRVRIEYIHFAEKKGPSVQFVFQFDGSEKGFFARDFWGRVMENKYQLFSLSMGLFARPFSYELNMGSADRESPERGRMSQILTKVERDLGAMISFEPRKKNHPLRYLKIDAGFFNGPGLNATADFDSHKDFITRIALKPYPISNHITLSAAASYFDGGLLQSTKYVYRTENIGGEKKMLIDSSLSNNGNIAPRKYYGADAQIKFKHKWGVTEIRAEYVFGTEPGTENSSEPPAALLTNTDAYYIRKFNGAYFYFLQNIFNPKHQLAVKYDWFDANSEVKGMEIGKPGNNLNAANIKFTTLGLGYIYYASENLKLVLWYDKVFNEKTQLAGYTKDVKDDIFTCRLQFRF